MQVRTHLPLDPRIFENHRMRHRVTSRAHRFYQILESCCVTSCALYLDFPFCKMKRITSYLTMSVLKTFSYKRLPIQTKQRD